MACVALKRPLEINSMCANPSKRARYAGPVRGIAISSPAELAQPSFTTDHQLPRKMTLKKVATTTGAAPRRGLRPAYRLKFAEAAPRALEHVGTAQEADGDQPLFTYGQLKLICERRLKEQAQRIREDYNRILQDKLSEQYDTFVRFTHDQIMRGSYKQDAPIIISYLS